MRNIVITTEQQIDIGPFTCRHNCLWTSE